MSSQEDIDNLSPDSESSKDNIFQPKPQLKIIRVLTVLAYVLSVSLAAILLSIYYVFIWEGHPHLGALTQPAELGNYSQLQVNASANNSSDQAKLKEDFQVVPSVNINAIQNETATESEGEDSIDEYRSGTFMKKLGYVF